jgi:CubicO group peptidase (beta-lactamase class C family)
MRRAWQAAEQGRPAGKWLRGDGETGYDGTSGRPDSPMRRLLLPIVATAVLLARVPAHADDLLLDRFRDYLEALRIQTNVPGLSVSVIGYNETAWERAFGKQDVERSIATRPDTPFAVDGVTEVFTSAIVLRCIEEGQLSLDDPIGKFSPGSGDANVTIRQALSHTSNDQVFRYRPDRVEALAPAIAACTGNVFVETVARRLDRFAMVDSVPGSDVVQQAPSPSGNVTSSMLTRYRSALARLAVPYAVDARGAASPSRYVATTLTPTKGLISTVQDIGQFMLGLRKGLIVRPETLALAWRPAAGANGQGLPHGLGWFVQSYNGETIVWQFGLSERASSSLIVTVPGRGITMVLLANSDGLSWPFPLANGDLTASPFGRLFLGLFVR